MTWWEREKLLTKQDKDAISRAKKSDWTEIDEDWAETDAGRYEIHQIIISKYHDDELGTEML